MLIHIATTEVEPLRKLYIYLVSLSRSLSLFFIRLKQFMSQLRKWNVYLPLVPKSVLLYGFGLKNPQQRTQPQVFLIEDWHWGWLSKGFIRHYLYLNLSFRPSAISVALVMNGVSWSYIVFCIQWEQTGQTVQATGIRCFFFTFNNIPTNLFFFFFFFFGSYTACYVLALIANGKLSVSLSTEHFWRNHSNTGSQHSPK